MNIRKLLVLLLVLTAAFCSLPANATTDFVATPFYTILAWSPDETRVLALIQPADDDPFRARLGEMDVQSRAMTILEETQSNEWGEPFRSRIAAMMAKGYRPGRVLLGPCGVPEKGRTNPPLPKPVVPVMNQKLIVESTTQGTRLILRESLPGIETAMVVVADLDERLHQECPALFDSANQDRSKDFYMEEVFVSPTLQWAFAPITVTIDRPFNATYYCIPTFFPLARESSKLLNICGYRLYLKKDYERAEEQFVQAFFLDSANAQAIYNLACVCALTNRPFDAMNYVSRAIEIDPKYREKAKTDPDFEALRSGNYPFLW